MHLVCFITKKHCSGYYKDLVKSHGRLYAQT